MGATAVDTMEQRLTELESVILEQRTLIEAQRDEIAEVKQRLTPPAASPRAYSSGYAAGVGSQQSDGQLRNRRTLFKMGIAAAGAAVAAPILANTASAADGGPIIIGAANAGTTDTTLVASAGAFLSNENIFTVSDSATSSGFEAAIGGFAQGVRVRNGMYAFTNVRDNNNTATGHAIVARAESGSRSNILLTPSSGDPRFDTFSHRRGEVRSDATGRLWFCTDGGTPGTWRKLAGFDSSGALHAISPQRVYDSRLVDGPLATGADRTISVANAINPDTGAVSISNLVPSGATAVMFNATVAATVAQGHLSVTPGGTPVKAASTINWSSAGLSLANGSMSTLDASRQLKVFCGGVGSTQFIIDIVAYTL